MPATCASTRIRTTRSKRWIDDDDPPYIPLSKTASFTAYAEGKFLEPEHRRLAETFARIVDAGAVALLSNSELAPKDVVKKSLEIAGELCIYTNQNHIIETLD